MDVEPVNVNSVATEPSPLRRRFEQWDVRRKMGNLRQGSQLIAQQMDPRLRKIADATDDVGVGMRQDNVRDLVGAQSALLQLCAQNARASWMPGHAPSGGHAEAPLRGEPVEQADTWINKRDLALGFDEEASQDGGWPSGRTDSRETGNRRAAIVEAGALN